jgi:hypothetical protein
VSERPTTLGDLSELVRAKNAGPFWLTLDVFLRDAAAYRRATQAQVVTPDSVARAYRVPARSVQVFELPDLQVIKVSFPRAVSQGSIHDRDMHSGQQHVPLANLPVLDG